MRPFIALLFAFALATAAVAQKADDILATANGHVVKFGDLSPDTQKVVGEAPPNYLKVRTNLFEQFVAMRLFQAEAASRNTTTWQILAPLNAKVKDPTEAEIKDLYEKNKAQIEGHPLEEVRQQIVDYLRYQAQQKVQRAFVDELKAKYKYAAGKDVNSAPIAPTDVVATINAKPLTAKEFDDFSKFDLYQAKQDVVDLVLDETREKLLDALEADEAKAQGIDTSAYIAREITDKMKDFTDEERKQLATLLFDRLSIKYKVQLSYKNVDPVVETVPTGDSPSMGPADAPVTVVMFSDFQCSHCAATHPILKEAMAAYPGKIRFVVRDCPLEMIHPDAYRAALAAYAAQQQGKFFDYVEILYKNQSALDDAALMKYASQLGLNAKQFELDFKSDKAAAQVKRDLYDSESIGVHGTPTIFINGVRQMEYSVPAFKAAIDRALKK